jgi:pimeloyl-ACP methyl ester carboxylesterase
MCFKPVKFYHKGDALFGVIQEVTHSSKLGVVFLHGWGGYRIGPQRLFVECARAFAQQGIPSLRFDFRGRGESEGSGVSIVDMMDDVAPACDLLIKESGVEKVILFGICSGGEVAIGASTSHNAIVGCVLCSTPVLGRQGRETEKEVIQKTSQHTLSYFRKLFLKETWRKLITFNVNYRLILKIICKDTRPDKSVLEVEKAVNRQVNHFISEFKGELLFIYGSHDPITKESLGKYSEICNDISMKSYIINGANHNFYGIKWRQELIKHTLDFMKLIELNLF